MVFKLKTTAMYLNSNNYRDINANYEYRNTDKTSTGCHHKQLQS